MTKLVLTLFPAQPSSVSNNLHNLFIARADPTLLLGQVQKFVADLMLGHVASSVVLSFTGSCSRRVCRGPNG